MSMVARITFIYLREEHIQGIHEAYFVLRYLHTRNTPCSSTPALEFMSIGVSEGGAFGRQGGDIYVLLVFSGIWSSASCRRARGLVGPLLDVPMLAIGSINSFNLAVFVEYVESLSLSTSRARPYRHLW